MAFNSIKITDCQSAPKLEASFVGQEPVVSVADSEQRTTACSSAKRVLLQCFVQTVPCNSRVVHQNSSVISL